MNSPINLDLVMVVLLGLVALALVALLVAVLLVRRWRSQAESGLLQLGSELNTFVMQIEALQAVREDYGALRRQPYNDLSAELQKKINRLAQASRTLEEQWNELNYAHNRVPLSTAQNLLEKFPTARRNAQLTAQMWQLQAQIAQEMKDAQVLAGRIESLPEEIHRQARQATEGDQEMASLLADLHAAGLHGSALEQADDALLRLQQGLVHLPAEFTGEQPPDLEQARVREAASAAFTLLSDVQPTLDTWLPQVRTWEQQYAHAVDRYERLRKDATHLRKALEAPPVGLAVESFLAELEKVRDSAKALNLRLQKPQVDELRALEKDADHLGRIILDAAKRYDACVRQADELDHALLELESQLQQLSKSLSEVETLQVFPLQWDVARPALARLAERAHQLGGRDLRRNPQQVTETLTAASGLHDETAQLSEAVLHALASHREMLASLGTGVVADGEHFLVEAQALARAVQPYDPANWNNQLDLATFPKDVLQLEALQRRLTRLEQPSPVPESTLDDRLAEAQQLSGLLTQLRNRVPPVRARLEEISRQEADQKDELARAAATLDGLALLFHDTPALQELAGDALKRLRGEVAALQASLATPREGILERKVSRANALLDDLARQENAWLDRLTGDLQTHTQAIRKTLETLQPVVLLDERAAVDAQALLRRIGSAPANRKSGLNYLETAAELKRWNNEWQTAAASAQALQDLAEPVLAAYREADQARQSTRSALQAAGRLASGRRDWPPTRETLAGDVHSYQEMEKRLDGLRMRAIPAAALVRELDKLSRELDRLDDHARQATHQAESEQTAAVQVESELDALQQRWQALGQAHAGQAEVTRAVEDLLRQSEQRLSQLKSRYKRGGLDYEQTLAQLQALVAGLRDAHLATADSGDLSLE